MANGEVAFEPIERETVSTKIREQLLQRITTGELAPGDQVPSERELAERFQVARSSVREAMQGLVSLGVVRRRGNRSYVTEHLPEIMLDADDLNKAFVRQLFETRRVLEGPIFVLAANRADVGDHGAVRTIADQFTDDLDIESFRRLDREFHTTIAATCGNPLLIELYGKVLDQLFRSDEFHTLLRHGDNRDSVQRIIRDSGQAHRQIADALANGDPEAMQAAIGGHLADVERTIIDDLV